MTLDEPSELQRGLSVVGRRWRVIVAAILFTTLVAVLIGLLQSPTYEARTVLLAGQGRGLGAVETVDRINDVTVSLSRLADDRVVLQRALRESGVDDVDVDMLENRVAVEAPTDTQTIDISVTDGDPERARDLANAIAKAFNELIDERGGTGSDLTTSIWQRAETPDEPVAPRLPINAALGLALGLMGGLGLAFLRDHLDSQWRSPRDVEQFLGIPVLGIIPRMEKPGRARRPYA